MEKLKVLVMVPYLNGTGGTETVIKNLNSAYMQSDQKSRYELKLISFGGSKKIKWLEDWDKTVYSFSNSRFLQMIMYVIAMPMLCLKTILTEKPDAVVCTNPVIWEVVYFLRTLTKKNFKIYAWYHYSIKQKRVSSSALKRCDHFFAISTGIAKQLTEMGVDEYRITVLTNPVILDKSVKLIPRSNKSGCGDVTTHFLYVGRIDFDAQKNVQELFKALVFVQGEWKLDLFGTYSNRDKEALVAIAKRHGFTERIVFRGFNSDVWNNIRTADALVLTSNYEGFPMILCEAISHGIFAVSSDCETGPADIIQEDNGRLYTPGNTLQLAEILTSICHNRLPIPSGQTISNTMNKFGQENFIHVFEDCIINAR